MKKHKKHNDEVELVPNPKYKTSPKFQKLAKRLVINRKGMIEFLSDK